MGSAAGAVKERKVQVTFGPEGDSVRVPLKTTIAEAAKSAGVDLMSPCGGDGLCGKCKVVVKQGNVAALPTSLLSREEIRRGYVLACQTMVMDDVEVEIPPESRTEGAQILIDLDAQRFRAMHPVAGAIEVRFAPLTRKFYLELPPPTLDDNLSDQSRLFREIRRRVHAPIMQLGLKVLQALPALLRDADWKVTVTLGWRGGTLEVLQVEPGNSGRNLGISVDVGTSTVVTHLIDLDTTARLDAEAMYNSQRAWGDEVTRRIIHAGTPGGLEELQKAVVNDINRMISALVERNNVPLSEITSVICAGNSTMMHLLLGLDPTSIRKAPYVLSSAATPPIRAVEVGIGINPRGLLYTVPSIGGWVGGDVTAGIMAVGLRRAEKVQMLIDIGTNGEIAVGNREWTIACSASAGPAFEGSGVKHGMKAIHGAIERVEIGPEGSIHYRTVGNGRPRGICGSGLIDLVAEMHRVGFIDRSGHLLSGKAGGRVRETNGLLEFVLVPASRSDIGKDIVITQADLSNLLSAKAAIYAATQVLARVVGLDFKDVEQLYIAGGFGNYLDRVKAIAIGLIPDLPLERIRFVGNTSILGADLGLLSQDAWQELTSIAESVTYYELINYPDYYDEFLAARFIPHTDLGRFKSVRHLQPVEAGA